MTHFFTRAAFMIDENIEHVFQYMKCSIAYLMGLMSWMAAVYYHHVAGST